MEIMNEERENSYKRPRRGILASGWQRGINFICLLAAVTAVTSPAQTYSVLYTFTGGTDGGYPAYGGLIADAAGNLYGATAFGGDIACPPSPSASVPGNGCGVVFKLDLATKQETVLYTFSGEADGSNPWSGLVRDPKGNLYGTAPFGGHNNAGVIFKVDPSGNETVLHTFDHSDGSNPTADLLLDTSGNLYGTTATGGDIKRCAGLGCGVIFRQSHSGGFKLLHIFTGPAKGDGASPTHGLTRDAAGNIYGTSENGGLPACDYDESFEPVATLVAGCGTIFKLEATTGDETLLYEFNAAPDASNPRAPLIRDAAGNIYGTTFYGGLYGAGSVFKLDPGGQETVLYSFTGLTDGANPWSGVVRDTAGNLYGITNHAGGPCYCGTVFKLDPAGNYTVLHTFAGTDGQYPGEPLLIYRGVLYGMTSGGGTLSDGSLGTGVIFKITPDPVP